MRKLLFCALAIVLLVFASMSHVVTAGSAALLALVLVAALVGVARLGRIVLGILLICRALVP